MASEMAPGSLASRNPTLAHRAAAELEEMGGAASAIPAAAEIEPTAARSLLQEGIRTSDAPMIVDAPKATRSLRGLRRRAKDRIVCMRNRSET